MRQYALRRLSYLPLILFMVSALTFFLLRSPWGSNDPAILMLGQGATPQEFEDLRVELGLRDPFLVQYRDYMIGIFTFDFGNTFRGDQPVVQEVTRRLPATVQLGAMTLLWSTLAGVTMGVVAAVKRATPTDHSLRVLAVFGQSIPDFFLLVMLIVLPSLWWNYVPPIGGHVSIFEDPLRNLRLYVPPTFVLGLSGAALMMRLTRSTMLEVLRQDYVRTARAKGLVERRVVIGHGFRNAMIPIITLLGAYIPVLFLGTAIAERVFSINGLGQFFLTSALARDFPVMQFLVFYVAVLVVLLNLLIDLSYAVIDPRVKYT